MQNSNTRSHPDFGEEVLLIFVGYSRDGSKAADSIVDLEKELQRELDKLKRVNRASPYRVIKIWKWESDASSMPGGQAAVITPNLERADIAVFVFNERIGDVAWHELNQVRGRKPAIPVLPFFPAQPPLPERMMQAEVVEMWSDLVKKRDSLAKDWVDPNSSAVTPLPQYKDLGNLSRLAAERITNEIVQLVGQYTDTAQQSAFSNTPQLQSKASRYSYILGYSGKDQKRSGEISSNLLSVCPSDFGRYAFTIEPTLAEYNGATLILDPSGQIYELTAAVRQQHGPVVKLDPWSVLTPDSKGVDSLNPFEIYKSLGFSTSDTVRLISELFFPYRLYQYRRRERANLDPFWPEMQRKFLVGLFHVAISEKEGIENVLPRVAELVYSEDVVYSLAKKIDESSAAKKTGKQEGIIDPEGYKEISAFLQLTDATRSGIIAGVSHALSAFISPRVKQAVGNCTFDVERWIQGEPMTIYIVGSSLATSALDSLYQIWLGGLQAALLQSVPNNGKSRLIVLDIHESFQKWPGLISAICHRPDFQTWIVASDISSIEWAFEDFSEQVLDSIGVFQIFKPRNRNSAQKISGIVNYSIEDLLRLGRHQNLSLVEGAEPKILNIRE